MPPIYCWRRGGFLEFMALQQRQCIISCIHQNASTQGPPTSSTVQVNLGNVPQSLWQQTRAKNRSAKWRDFISRLLYILGDHISGPRGPPASPGPRCSPKLKRFLASSVEPPGNMKYLPPRNPDSPLSHRFSRPVAWGERSGT